jgi:hypothetical protein
VHACVVWCVGLDAEAAERSQVRQGAHRGGRRGMGRPQGGQCHRVPCTATARTRLRVQPARHPGATHMPPLAYTLVPSLSGPSLWPHVLSLGVWGAAGVVPFPLGRGEGAAVVRGVGAA